MGPNYKLLHSKGRHKQNEKTIYRIGKNICKGYDRQVINFPNRWTPHAAQPNQKMGSGGREFLLQMQDHGRA